MPRFLLLIILLWVIYVLLKYVIRRIKSQNEHPSSAKQAEKVIACARCGLHVPENETRIIDGKVRCNNPSCMDQA